MIHGMFGGSWCWDNDRGFFERRGYRCLTPVLRYHDVDPKDKPNPNLGTVSLLDYADDLEQRRPPCSLESEWLFLFLSYW